MTIDIKSLLFDKDKHLFYARKIASFLEFKFSVFKFKFGVDPILGLVPGLGDVITTILSFYLVYVAILHKIKFTKIVYMVVYILIDLGVGSIPILGDMLDFVIKPNTKNLEILESEIKDQNKIV